MGDLRFFYATYKKKWMQCTCTQKMKATYNTKMNGANISLFLEGYAANFIPPRSGGPKTACIL